MWAGDKGLKQNQKDGWKRRRCLGWSPHSCPRLQSPAGRSQTGSLSSLLFIHSPTHPGLWPPPRERARNTQKHHIRDKGKGAQRETERLGEMKKEKKPERLSNFRDKRRSANRQDGQRRWPGWAWRGRSERQGGQSWRAPGAGGRREAGGTRRRFSGRPRPAVPAAPRASFHTSPPPAPSVRSREYPPPPRPHLLLPCHPLACRRPPTPRGREEPLWSPGPSSARVRTAGHGWRGRPEPERTEGRARGLQRGL